MRSRGPTLIGFLLLLPLAGCFAPSPLEGQSETAAERFPRVVVAVLDTGVNPYHEVFARGTSAPADGAAKALALTPRRLATVGEYEARREADASFWEGIERGELVAFEGTALLGVSFKDEGPRLIDGTLPGEDHGTATASIVARTARDVAIVVVQADLVVCDTPDCLADDSVAEAMRWIAEQPWIDIVSTSFGIPGNVPDSELVHDEVRPFLEASRLAHANGKIVVSAAGNEPTPALASYMNAPPWMISVTGTTFSERGDAPMSGRLADVAGNYSELVASASSITDSYWNVGTSFASPNVAAALARALEEIRATIGDERWAKDSCLARALPLSAECAGIHEDFRSGLNATSLGFAPTDWSPGSDEGNRSDPLIDALYQGFAVTLPILAPGAQGGWGYVDARLSHEIARRVLAGDFEIADEKRAVAAFQEKAIGARREYWSRFG